MREIIFDTETTGFDPATGDRMVEIGCIEMVSRVMTGNHYHAYFNPQRPMPAAAENVHGLSDRFLSDKPAFGEKADELLEFLGDSPLVAHNASFDMGVLRSSAALIEVELPDLRYGCSLIMARKTYNLESYRLNQVAYAIGHEEFDHHDALADSDACARIVIHMADRHGVSTLDELAKLTNHKIKSLRPESA